MEKTMKIGYIDKNFKSTTLAIIAKANEIINDYAAQGFSLTLRQLYYQFVARDLLPNTERSYKRLGSIINDGRMAGYIDWDAIEDRTRNVKRNLHLSGPANAIEVVRDQYGIDMWENQPERVEVWIEKEALAGVIAGVCSELDVPYFACKGYVSQSEQWRAGRRFRDPSQRSIILHLGDHDPSGIDMTRDNQDRLSTFSNWNVDVERIALNMDQIDEYGPPPNPAKMTDARFRDYMLEYGTESWELDALEPRVISSLIRENVAKHRDESLWDEKQQELDGHLETLDNIIANLS
jgi:hypothetical protein